VSFEVQFAQIEGMQTLMYAMSFLERLFPIQWWHYYEDVSKFPKDLAVVNGEDKILVVGSLGGGLSHIFGVLT
jgi:hypothetical protein